MGNFGPDEHAMVFVLVVVSIVMIYECACSICNSFFFLGCKGFCTVHTVNLRIVQYACLYLRQRFFLYQVANITDSEGVFIEVDRLLIPRPRFCSDES